MMINLHPTLTLYLALLDLLPEVKFRPQANVTVSHMVDKRIYARLGECYSRPSSDR